jgi:neutral ceramidase
MRLRARAFYFRDTRGQSLALASCDLVAITAGLQEMVAANLHQGPGRQVPDISPDNLILVATHTHQGPGNYMSNKFYNGFASPYPGFDHDLFEHLAGLIANAIRQAAADAELHPEGAVLAIRRGAASISRNRAILAFVGNPDDLKNRILQNGPAVPLPIDCQSDQLRYSAPCLRYRAVDPSLTVVDLGRPGVGPVASMVFYSVHPTVISHDVSFFSPDFTGWAMAEMERRSGRHGYVAAWFNGADADVSPKWDRRDAADVRELGRQFLSAIESLRQQAPQAIEGDSASVSSGRAVMGRHAFCGTDPVAGVATLGGAEDGRFVTFDMGWRERARRGPGLEPPTSPDPAQGGKQPALGIKGTIFDLTGLEAPPSDFAAEVPATVARLGRLAFLAVPAEITTAMALLAREGLSFESGTTSMVVGPSNEYFEYIATAGEYGFQEYVGASTLFGTRTGECLIDLLKKANAATSTQVTRTIPVRHFDPGPDPSFKVRFGPAYWGLNPEYGDQELESPFSSYSHFPRDLWPRVEWASEDADTEVSLFGSTSGGHWELELDDGDARWEAQRDSSDLFTILIDGTAGKRRWLTVWLPDPRSEGNAPRPHVIRIRSGNAVYCSPAFSLEDVASGKTPVPLKAQGCREFGLDQ